MIAELHVAPNPAGTDDAPYDFIEAAIEVISASGLAYEVGALGTTFEGPADLVWATLRAAHDAVLAAGADRTITSIRIAEWSTTADAPPSIDDLTSSFRRS